MAMKCATIILAAGESKRLGQPKQLLPFCGKTLVRYAVDRSLRIGCSSVVAVTGAYAELVAESLDGASATVVFNAQWRTGMGQSIACGVASLLESGRVFDGVLLQTVDQPLIPDSHLQTLISECQRHGHPIATGYPRDRPGIPACVPWAALPELSTLIGDRGAQQVLIRAAATILACPEAELDIDTEANLEILQNKTPASRDDES